MSHQRQVASWASSRIFFIAAVGLMFILAMRTCALAPVATTTTLTEQRISALRAFMEYPGCR